MCAGYQTFGALREYQVFLTMEPQKEPYLSVLGEEEPQVDFR